MKWLVLLIVASMANVAAALDWYVEPNPAWAGDPTVNVEYVYTSGSPTGPVIGAAALLIGPLLPGQPRPIAADQFVGRGGVVCIVANAVRGTERGETASRCDPFRLGAPSVSSPR